MATYAIESRVLAGIEFEDAATATPVNIPLDVRAAEGQIRVETFATRRGIYVIGGAEGLEDYAAAFETPPAMPLPGTIPVAMEVRDPSGVYLPRRFTVALPRVADREAADNVFQPVTVALYRSPLAPRSQNWAMLRVRISVAPTTDPVPAALLRVVHDPAGDREILGIGMSVVADPRARRIEREGTSARARWVHLSDRHLGEATVPVVGLSGQVWSEGVPEPEPDPEADPGGGTAVDPVVLTDIPATLEVLPMTLPGPGEVPNPDDFLGASAAPGNTRAITLSVGGDVLSDPFPVTL